MTKIQLNNVSKKLNILYWCYIRFELMLLDPQTNVLTTNTNNTVILSEYDSETFSFKERRSTN